MLYSGKYITLKHIVSDQFLKQAFEVLLSYDMRKTVHQHIFQAAGSFLSNRRLVLVQLLSLSSCSYQS